MVWTGRGTGQTRAGEPTLRQTASHPTPYAGLVRAARPTTAALGARCMTLPRGANMPCGARARWADLRLADPASLPCPCGRYHRGTRRLAARRPLAKVRGARSVGIGIIRRVRRLPSSYSTTEELGNPAPPPRSQPRQKQAR
ncbi:hypothetical protein PSPO01_13305 [Paraphaeosphaeria sporulosa]